MKIILLQAGNMRNVAPYEGNPIMEFLMQFSFFSTLFFIIAALVFLFFIFSFFGFVVPEIFGGKDIIEYLETKSTKKEVEKKDLQLRLGQKRIQEQNEYRERSRCLHEEAERKVLTYGWTKEKLDEIFNIPAFEKMDEKTKKTIKEAIKDSAKKENQKIYDAYILHNQASLIDLSQYMKNTNQ